MTQHNIQLEKLRVSYLERTAETEKTILFIHGRAMSAQSWENQFNSEMLAPFRLIALDLPGHGMSDRISSHADKTLYSIRSLRDIIIEFISLIELADFIIVGLSLGAHTALQALPLLKNCRGIFAMTMPATKPMRPDLMYHDLELLGQVFCDKARPENIERYSRLLLDPRAGQIPEFVKKSYYQTDPRIHEGILLGLIDLDYEDETQIIKQTAIPVAIALGCGDQIHNLNYLSQYSFPLWSGGYILIPDAGHLVAWENAPKVNSLIELFASTCF
ncbi:Pimeloyl-ACP methyl ester carboxylesterase [Dyadobacter sp. SG02]|uniref:alpha/beta fold hydrolase n=1 Tax=Dyadobacter sp. SG02 TaxID=1855291 RepID=UPI0008B582AA|nr:alpha/beta hydrolase [Dyadobacter sp. SG02]SEJ79422.1 Pimeloyl-ACP methyl ester carboxylesterase [Dyadobacter sp. SG02]